MSKILGIIPARIGSQRVPNKNFRNFGGKPLVLHSLEQALKSEKLDRIIVSTNHKDLPSLIPTTLLEYFITRPEAICHSKARGYSYVKHAIEHCKQAYKEEFTHFVTLPPTGPLRISKDIDNCIEKLLKENCDTVTSMVEVNMMYHGIKQKEIVENDTIKPFLIEENGRAAYYQLPKVYVRNCAIYASKIEVIEKESMIGADCRAYIMPPERSIDINEMIDFEFAEFLHKKKEGTE